MLCFSGFFNQRTNELIKPFWSSATRTAMAFLSKNGKILLQLRLIVVAEKMF